MRFTQSSLAGSSSAQEVGVVWDALAGVHGTSVTEPGAKVDGVNGKYLVDPDSVMIVIANLLVKLVPIVVKIEKVAGGGTKEVGKPVKLAWYCWCHRRQFQSTRLLVQFWMMVEYNPQSVITVLTPP